MRSAFIARILLAGVSMQVAATSPAWAAMQTSGSGDQESVLMRRPIDDRIGRTDIPTDNPNPNPNPGGGTDPVDPADPVDPTDPNNPSIPTDQPIEGGSHDPDLVNDPGDPGWAPGTYQWTTGPWHGAAVCGQRAQLTRDVGCQRIMPFFDGGGPIGRVDPALSGRPEVMNASWGMSTVEGPRLSNGVYDPSASGVKQELAQFGGSGDGSDFLVQDVPISYCREVEYEIGSAPINTYTGTQGGCQYDPVKTGSTEWELPPFASGTASCSASAFRMNQYRCQASDGSSAPLAYCLENLSEGGVRNGQLITPEYGNFSGCTARWVTYVEDNYCHKSGDLSNGYGDDGPVHTANYQSRCIRSDGTELTGIEEAACAASDRPFDGVQVVGACHKQYAVDYQYACLVDNNDVVVHQEIGFYDYYTEGTRMCNDAGATCCSLRQVSNNNYSGAPYRAYEVIGTKGTAVSNPGWYFDDRARRISSEGEGPYFYNYGGGRGRFEPDQYVGGVIDPEPGNGGGGGGDPDN
jgi:hypothetical protein